MTNELIGCRTCSSPCCKGCNMFTLFKALEAGKFDALMSENHTLHDRDLDNLERDRWISVEERLPENGEHVLACCFVKWLGGGGKSYVCDAYYAKPKTLTVNSWGDDIAYEYDEETDEYYLLEGWYEVIKNWDDYDSISIGDFVTHWKPLPEPPKEEGA